MKTIVVGYDETEPSKRALERAADIAEAFGSRVVVTSVSGVLLSAAHSTGGPDPTDLPEKHQTELEHAREYLAGRNVKAELQPAVGEPAEAIVQAAEDVGADLIVVGSRELGLVSRMLGQSVSGSVSRHAHCDVLIVH
jgi:nucleotide-binding universal stress UspA family protein